MNNYLVYCHKVPNDKIYIGITNNPISRFRKGKGYYDNESFYSDICKFGWDKIEHLCLAKGLSKDSAEYFETLFIIAYQSYLPNKGYNRQIGLDYSVDMAIDKLNAAKIYGLDNKPDVLDTYFNRDKSLSEIELITKNKKLNRELNSAYEQLEIYEKQLDKALLEIDKLNEELSEIKR